MEADLNVSLQAIESNWKGLSGLNGWRSLLYILRVKIYWGKNYIKNKEKQVQCVIFQVCKYLLVKCCYAGLLKSKLIN